MLNNIDIQGNTQFTLAISFIISWYLVAEDTSPACSNVRRFLWIFLFFCSIGSCPSSKIDWLCFIFSGALESKMARFSTSFKFSDSWGEKKSRTVIFQILITVKSSSRLNSPVHWTGDFQESGRNLYVVLPLGLKVPHSLCLWTYFRYAVTTPRHTFELIKTSISARLNDFTKLWEDCPDLTYAHTEVS